MTASSVAAVPAPSRISQKVHDYPTSLAFNGYLALFVALGALVFAVLSVIGGVSHNNYDGLHIVASVMVLAVGLVVLAILCFSGIYSLQPNESAVLTLFGSYVGTDAKSGLRFTVPFFNVRKVSQRVRYHECEKLKVNDLMGNPIEIGAVVVWRVADSAKAIFQIDNYTAFVGAQTETSLRHIAGRHPYDFSEAETAAEEKPADKPAPKEAVHAGAEKVKAEDLSLRESGVAVTDGLVSELRHRLEIAGVTVDEARITHLAYAPEIAPVMLRKQQASAVIAARRLVVRGAVDIVKEALDLLKTKAEINLDDERKAAMVSNLLVVLVSDKDASPVINAGTLYG